MVKVIIILEAADIEVNTNATRSLAKVMYDGAAKDNLVVCFSNLGAI